MVSLKDDVTVACDRLAHVVRKLIKQYAVVCIISTLCVNNYLLSTMEYYFMYVARLTHTLHTSVSEWAIVFQWYCNKSCESSSLCLTTKGQPHTYTQTHAHMDTDRQTDTCTGTQTDRQTNRQTDRQTHTHTHTHKHTHTHTQTHIHTHTHTNTLGVTITLTQITKSLSMIIGTPAITIIIIQFN